MVCVNSSSFSHESSRISQLDRYFKEYFDIVDRSLVHFRKGLTKVCGIRQLAVFNCDYQRALKGVLVLSNEYHALTGNHHFLERDLRADLTYLIGEVNEAMFQRTEGCSRN